MPELTLADAPAPEVRVLDSRELVAGHVWDIRRDRLAFGDAELERDYMDHPGAVAVLALDEDDRVLLIPAVPAPRSRTATGRSRPASWTCRARAASSARSVSSPRRLTCGPSTGRCSSISS